MKRIFTREMYRLQEEFKLEGSDKTYLRGQFRHAGHVSKKANQLLPELERVISKLHLKIRSIDLKWNATGQIVMHLSCSATAKFEWVAYYNTDKKYIRKARNISTLLEDKVLGVMFARTIPESLVIQKDQKNKGTVLIDIYA